MRHNGDNHGGDFVIHLDGRVWAVEWYNVDYPASTDSRHCGAIFSEEHIEAMLCCGAFRGATKVGV